MFVADAHCDTLYSIAIGGIEPENCAVTAARMAQGGVGLQTFALFAGPNGSAGTPYENGRKMLGKVERLGVPIHMGPLPDLPPESPSGVLSIEGGEMLEGSFARLDEFDQVGGIRMIALTWNHENEIGHPAKANGKGGLKSFGKSLLRKMDERGILTDVSHLNEAGFWDVMDLSELPPVASHSNMKSVCNHRRNLSDEQIRAIIDRKGFVGINFYSNFIKTGGVATLQDLLRHIDGVAQMGGISVLGFGSDFDGIDEWPDGLANPADFPNLIELLRNHGYTQADLAALAGGNLFNLYKRAERARKVKFAHGTT